MLVRHVALTQGAAWALTAPVVASAGPMAASVTYHVATDGNDAWSGALPSPNTDRTDGPFATLSRARDAIRQAHAAAERRRPVTVLVRGGCYYLAAPLRLRPQDSGTEACPITYRAYPGERPILSGGRPVTGWHKADGRLWAAPLDGVEPRPRTYQQFFVDGKRKVRARHPNVNRKNPALGGFLFARRPATWVGSYGCGLTNMLPGDWAEYDFEVPEPGRYHVWIRYAAHNKPWGTSDIGTGDRTTVRLDTGEPIALRHLPDTGSWTHFKWSSAANATVELSAGKHTLRWTNNKGPGLNIDAIALANDLTWKPVGTPPRPIAAGKALIELHGEVYQRIQGEQHRTTPYRTQKHLYFDRGSLKAWPRSPDKVLHIWIYQQSGLCSNALVPVARIDDAESRLDTTEPVPWGIARGARFFVDNVREALDSPGEWVLDRAAGTILYWPQQADFAERRTVVSHLDRLVEISGDDAKGTPVRHVSLEGFTFEATDYAWEKDHWYHGANAAVWLSDAQHCRIVHNTFVNLGGAAVAVIGHSTDNQIVGNEVAYGGAGGFTINSHPQNLYALDTTPTRYSGPDSAQRNRVTGNHIHHIGLIWMHGAGVYLHRTSRNVVSHNLIHDTSRHPIIITGRANANVIEFNEILHSNLQTGDTGAIHTYRTDVADEGTIIRNNVIGDVVGMGTTPDGKILRPYYTWGIYLDGYSSRAVVRNNIVYRTVRGGIMINGGDDNLIENNVLVDGRDSQIFFNLWKGRGKGNRFVGNVVAWSAAEATLCGGSACDLGPEYARCDRNLYWHGGRSIPQLDARRRRGLDEHAVIADPQFVDPNEDDYRLKPGSPAFKLGFKPIDTSQVGLRGASAADRRYLQRKMID